MLTLLSGLALAALVAVPVVRLAPRIGPWLLAGVPAAGAVWLVSVAPTVFEAPLEWRHAWVPGLDLELALRLDPLALVFALLVCGIGSAVVVYAGGYMRGKALGPATIAGLLGFATAMTGLVLADDLVLMFVCWEATSVASYLLVGLDHRRAAAREGARRALLITAGGGLALLGGLVALSVITGTGTISELPVLDHPAGTWIALAVLLAAFTKSAQAPFHLWLPGAMAAPTPVSAYLHSATMVKAGIYLVLRLGPTLEATPPWNTTLMVVGGATALLGGLLALVATDLKRVLACSTIAALGTMLAVAGVDHPAAYSAVVAMVVAHALYKAALFMVAGGIEKATGTRDLGALRGLGASHRWLWFAAASAAASAAACVPSFGFAAKETALGLAMPIAPGVSIVLAVIGVAFTYVALAMAAEPFLGPRPDKAPKALGISVVGPPIVLGALGVVAGVLAGPLGRSWFDPVAQAPAGLALWHGVGIPLIASVSSIVVGWFVWRARARVRVRLTAVDRAADPRLHDAVWTGIVAVARVVTDAVQPRALRASIGAVALSAAGLVLIALVRSGASMPGWGPAPDALDAVLAVFIIGGALAAAVAPHRSAAIGALGGVGVGIALFFLRHGAPDLAMTLLIVEALSVVLLVLAFGGLPELRAARRGFPGAWSAGVAITVGLAVAAAVHVAGGIDLGPGVSGWFAENAVPEGRGRNVVNVILVDFRALDTLGEIAVLAIAALGAGALIGSRGQGRDGP